MASSSSKARSNSPFRFFKSSASASSSSASSNHQQQSSINIPSLKQVLEPATASSSSSNQLLGFGLKGHSLMQGRSFMAGSNSNSKSGRAGGGGAASSSSSSSIASKVDRFSSQVTSLNSSPSIDNKMEFARAKECVSVTIRFRPLSTREMQKGDEAAWYADGDTTVRCEYNQQTAYAFDKVFGPATSTRAVYDAAARQVIRGAMEGVNGTVFAYGVTSSGKTHTMHGDQKSPGIIPMAIKDVFSIIQDTPGREYLLRVSYLEIYNEVINDLLNPAGQNLRVREDSQGTYVEGVKEEVVLSPAHALSLIAAGEEHRHVGSNNFNLLSSRSHTIFTMTIESRSDSANASGENLTFSLLNLIDLAGSESSKTETTGLRRKEGAYINKSLLTLGTVIAKLSDGKPSHVPFRDSKLTRILQSSLSGHGRVSLICTITPASSYFEETHNTLKFAHRAKRIEIRAAPNKLMDEKSLIKKYQKEITTLKEELEQLKRGMMDKRLVGGEEDLVNLRQQLEMGQAKMQSRLEDEEQAKAALLGRIQRLTKLILVSTKNTISPALAEPQPVHRRRHSFGEDERIDRTETVLAGPVTSLPIDYSPSAASSIISRSQQFGPTLEEGCKKSISLRKDEFPLLGTLPQRTQAGELFSAAVHNKSPLTGETVEEQLDLLREQIKMLAGEVAFRTSSLKRMLEQSSRNPNDSTLQAQIQKVKDEIHERKHQINLLEKHISGSEEGSMKNGSSSEMPQTVSKLMGKLNEMAFELEIKTADNRVLQEQLQAKLSENRELVTLTNSLKEQLAAIMEKMSSQKKAKGYSVHSRDKLTDSIVNEAWLSSNGLSGELHYVERNIECDVDARSCSSHGSMITTVDSSLQNQLLSQAAEIEKLKQENIELMEEKAGLQIHAQKLREESLYAKELASAAAVELKNLAEEVTKLSIHNAKLQKDLNLAQELSFTRVLTKPAITELQKELHAKTEREAGLEAALADKENMETHLQRKLEEAKKKEADLESDLAGMWMLVSKMRKDRESFTELNKAETGENFEADLNKDKPSVRIATGKNGNHETNKVQVKELEIGRDTDELKAGLGVERQRSKGMEMLISQLSQLKSEELNGLNITALEDLQNLHVEALTKLCQAKAQMQQRLDREKEQVSVTDTAIQDDERSGHICKVCFEAPTAAVLLPCRHFCLCKACAVACTECPLCRSGITDRIITFTS